MSRVSRRCAYILVLGTTFAACVQTSANAPEFTEEDASAVRNNLRTYMQSDPIDAPNTFFSQFAEDIHWTFSDQAPWVGMQGLQNVDWCHTVSAEIVPERISGSGDLAYARGAYDLTIDCAVEGTVNRQGPFMSAHRRQSDGSWRIETLLQPTVSSEAP